MNDYRVELPVFNGPLDLLLHLIEREELDITAVSLLEVTDQYLKQIQQMVEGRVDHLIDFLTVGARLTVIKSRALLPKNPVVQIDEEDEEDPAEALIRQLRAYKRFKEAATWLDERQLAGLRTYLRVAPPPKIEGRLDLSGVTLDILQAALVAVLERSESKEESVSVARPRRLTIEDQLGNLRRRLAARRAFLFSEILSTGADSTEVAVSLLALLELIKRREAAAVQAEMFGPIHISPVAPAAAPAT